MFAKLKQKTLEDKPKPVVQKSSQQDAEEPSKVSSVQFKFSVVGIN